MCGERGKGEGRRETLDLQKPKDVEVNEKCQVKSQNSFVFSENSGDRARESIRHNASTSVKRNLVHYELRLRKRRFEEECPESLDKSYQAKLQRSEQ
jgi:hypothetical protein